MCHHNYYTVCFRFLFHDRVVMGNANNSNINLKKISIYLHLDILKNLSRYRQCRRSHTKKKCAVLFLRKHFHSERQEGRRPERHKTAHNNKRHKKHEPNKERNLKYNNRRKTKHSNKHNNNENLDKNNNNKKSKHPLKNNNSKKRDGHGSDKQSYVNTNLTKHEPRKQHRNKHHVKPAIKNRKHLLRLKSYEKSSQ